MSKATERTLTRGLTGSQYAAVTPSDTADLPDGPCGALYIGVSGDVCLVSPEAPTTDQGVVFKSVPIGPLPIGARRVRSTGTTATNIVAVY